MLDDADLVRATQGGDATSLGLLLERYRAPMYGQALGILGYGPQAEDAVHDAFVVALRKIGTVGEPAAVGGWLHAVLRNVCLMRLRTGRGEILFDEMQPHAREPPRRWRSKSPKTIWRCASGCGPPSRSCQRCCG